MPTFEKKKKKKKYRYVGGSVVNGKKWKSSQGADIGRPDRVQE